MSNQVRFEIPSNLKTTPKKTKKQSSLAAAEEAFLLRKFLDALSLSYQSLSKIAENTTRAFYYYDQKATVTTETPGESESPSHKFRSVIQQLNSLYHECSNPITCECIPYMAIVVQSIFEIQKETNDQDPLIDDVVSFLLQFYGTIHKIPYQILILSVNGLINKKNYEEAFSLLTYCLTKKTETGAKRKFAEEEYESLCQLYLFHVLPKLEKWNEAESFLKSDDVLTDWKKEAFLRHVHLLKSEAESASVQQVPLPQETIPVETVQESPKQEEKAVVSKPSFFTVIKNLKIWNIVFGVSFLASLFTIAILYFKSKKRIQQQPQNTKKKNNNNNKTARKVQNKQQEVSSFFSIFKSFANPYGRFT